jgi:hypothetical protein
LNETREIKSVAVQRWQIQHWLWSMTPRPDIQNVQPPAKDHSNQRADADEPDWTLQTKQSHLSSFRCSAPMSVSETLCPHPRQWILLPTASVVSWSLPLQGGCRWSLKILTVPARLAP